MVFFLPLSLLIFFKITPADGTTSKVHTIMNDLGDSEEVILVPSYDMWFEVSQIGLPSNGMLIHDVDVSVRCVDGNRYTGDIGLLGQKGDVSSLPESLRSYTIHQSSGAAIDLSTPTASSVVWTSALFSATNTPEEWIVIDWYRRVYVERVEMTFQDDEDGGTFFFSFIFYLCSSLLFLSIEEGQKIKD